MLLFSRSARYLACCAATLFCCAAGPASAQIDIVPKYRIMAGIMMPVNSAARDATSSIWPKIGADVKLPLIGVRAGIDYAFQGSSSITALTATYIIQPSAVVVQSPVYGGLGLGVWNVKISGVGSKSRVGARLVLGGEMMSFFVEGQYDLIGSIGGVRADGISLLIGKKF
jgi:hypothetical protein